MVKIILLIICSLFQVNTFAQVKCDEGIVLEIIINDIITTWYLSANNELKPIVNSHDFENDMFNAGWCTFYLGTQTDLLARCCEFSNISHYKNIESIQTDSTFGNNYSKNDLLIISKKIQDSRVKLKLNNEKYIVRAAYINSIICTCHWPYEPSVMNYNPARKALFVKELKAIRSLNSEEKLRLKKSLMQVLI